MGGPLGDIVGGVGKGAGNAVGSITGGLGDGVGKLGKGDFIGGVGSIGGGVQKGVGGLLESCLYSRRRPIGVAVASCREYWKVGLAVGLTYVILLDECTMNNNSRSHGQS